MMRRVLSLSQAVLIGLLFLASLVLGLNYNQAQAQSGIGRAFTVLSSAQRTATTTKDVSNLGENLNVRGGYIILKVTGAMTTPLITPSIQAKDPASGAYYNLLVASTGVSTNGTYVYLVYTGAITKAGVTQVSELPLPQNWRVSVAHDDTDPITYSVSAMLIP